MLILTNARVATVTKGILEKGTVAVENGRITAVGPEVEIPTGAEVVEKLWWKTARPPQK